VRLLLDTHVFLWASSEPEKLAARVRQALMSDGNDVIISAATAWEIAIKCAAGRMDFPLPFWDRQIADLGLEQLPITAAHALEAGALPPHHSDPFDRMLVAQARLEGLILVSSDKQIQHYDVPLFDRLIG
jgi:PIN domain nuclease of toxin-antitoxin system